jgi:hypothetical protein
MNNKITKEKKVNEAITGLKKIQWINGKNNN